LPNAEESCQISGSHTHNLYPSAVSRISKQYATS